VYEPLLDAEHDRVEAPDPPFIVVVVRPQDIPFVGEVVTVRDTAPAKPLVGLTVIVELRAELMLPLRLVGAALTVKSWIANMAVVECEIVPLIPVMVRV